MPLTARVKSASKTDFISGLGLVKDDQATKQLYDLMKVNRSKLALLLNGSEPNLSI